MITEDTGTVEEALGFLAGLAIANARCFRAEQGLAARFASRVKAGLHRYKNDNRTHRKPGDYWSTYLFLDDGKDLDEEIDLDCEDTAAAIAGYWAAFDPSAIVEVGIVVGDNVSHAICRVNGHIVDGCMWTGMPSTKYPNPVFTRVVV